MHRTGRTRWQRLKIYDPIIRYEYRKGTAVSRIARMIGTHRVSLWRYIERQHRRGSLQRRPREPRRAWTGEERELLRQLWNLHVPTAEIGRYFRRTPHNIQQTISVRRQRGEPFRFRARGCKAAGTTMPLRDALAWLRSIDQPIRCARCSIRLDLANHPDRMVRVPVANQYHLCLWCTQDHLLSPSAAAAVYSEAPIPVRQFVPPGRRESGRQRPRFHSQFG